MSSTADVVVIGAGINGTAIAFNLARQGLKVTLVEKSFIAGGPTGRSSAIIRQHYSNEVTARMVKRSLGIFQNFDEVVGGACDFKETGYLMGARAEDMEALKANIRMQQSVGINTSIISAEEMIELEPALSSKQLVAAAYEPESGYADPAATAGSFARRARELGAQIKQGTLVESIEIEYGRVTGLTTNKGPLSCGAVVVAAGPWSRRLLKDTGIDLPIEATRHEVCIFKCPEDLGFRAVYVDFIGSIYIRPETGNLMLVGSIEDKTIDDKVSDPDVFDDGVAFKTVSNYSEKVILRYPGMNHGRYASGYAALYDITPDWHAILDELPNVSGLYLAAGSSGHGFKLAPAVGEMMAELIVDGKTEGDDLSFFSFDRFAENRPITGKYEHSIVG